MGRRGHDFSDNTRLHHVNKILILGICGRVMCSASRAWIRSDVQSCGISFLKVVDSRTPLFIIKFACDPVPLFPLNAIFQ